MKYRYFLSILIFILGFNSSYAEQLTAANSPDAVLQSKIPESTLCERTIHFIPQSHYLDTSLFSFDTSDYGHEKSAYSQLKIAHYIQANKRMPVFSEKIGFGIVSIKGQNAALLDSHRESYSKIFPNGLPKEGAKLTEIQQEKMSSNGAEYMQLFWGEIDKIYGVAFDKQELDNLLKPIVKWYRSKSEAELNITIPPIHIRKLMFEEREKLALEYINDYFSKNPEKFEVILIFGAGHNFSFYPKLFPPECIKVPDVFQKNWSGKGKSNQNDWF